MHFSDCFDLVRVDAGKDSKLYTTQIKQSYPISKFTYTHAVAAPSDFSSNAHFGRVVSYADGMFSQTIFWFGNVGKLMEPSSADPTHYVDVPGMSCHASRDTEGYRFFRRFFPPHPNQCLYRVFADDEFSLPLASKIMRLSNRGFGRIKGDEAAEFMRTIASGRWIVAIVHAAIDSRNVRHASEPIDPVDDLPDKPPDSTANDPRFSFLATCNDYVIRCRGGTVQASKHMLAVRSDYFKRVLVDRTNQGQNATHFLDYERRLLEPVINFVHTGTFEIRERISLKDIRTLMRLTKLLELESSKLINAMCACLRGVLPEAARSGVHPVAIMAALGFELPFYRLAICAMKVIANEYYVAFKEYYNDAATDRVLQDVYRVLATEYTYDRELRDAHDEHLLIDDDAARFSPLDYIERVRQQSFTTQLMRSQG